jgi:hypothetical protein
MQKTIELRFDVGDKTTIWETIWIDPKNDVEKYPYISQPITEQVEIEVIVEKLFIEINKKTIDIRYLLHDINGNKFDRTENAIMDYKEKSVKPNEDNSITSLLQLEDRIEHFIGTQKSGDLVIFMNEIEYKKTSEFINGIFNISPSAKGETHTDSISVYYGGIDTIIKKL